MNKYEFRSAYDKITLSEDFKREAREKLRAMAGGDRSALTHTGDYVGRAVKIQERVKSPAKTVIGIISAAAVLAVCAAGGGYLLKNRGAVVAPPNNQTERQWLDYGTALEISLSGSEKPYSRDFAEELSDSARDNGCSFENITAYPCGDDYFAVKEYSYDYRDSDSYYYEIYLIGGNRTELLGEFDNTYLTLIGDGEYLYYIYDGSVGRISSDGDTENILELTETAPEAPSEAMRFEPFSKQYVSASGSGDILTLSNVCYYNSEGEGFFYNYTINVSTLESESFPVMPKPFADTDECDAFYQPFERYFAEIPNSLMFNNSTAPIDAYFDSFDAVNNPSDNIMGYPNIYSYIRHFNLTDEEVRKGLAFMTEDEEYGITRDDIDNFIIADNPDNAAAFFANEYAIVAGGKIYSANWVYLHSVEDWREAGIIDNGLAEAAEKYRDFGFENAARAAFEAKLEEALGYHVSLSYPSADYTEDAEPVGLTYDDMAAVDKDGNFVWSGQTGSADITLQPLEAVPAPDFDESGFTAFHDPAAAATEAIDRSKFYGITMVGQVDTNDAGAAYVYPLEDTYGVDMGKTSSFTPRVLTNYTLDAASSVYDDNLVSLHYTGSGGELYLNIASLGYGGNRCVTDGSGNIYTGFAAEMSSYVMSEEDDIAHNFTGSYGGYGYMYIGGRQVDGENYFYAYRKSGDAPEDFTLTLSAKGCTLNDFMDLIAAVVQQRTWGFGDFNNFSLNNGELPEYDLRTVETEQGTLVLNRGKYLGTGAGIHYDVMDVKLMSSDGVSAYTKEDMLGFSGNSALFELPLGFEPTETIVSYGADYAEFHDGYNIQLFHEGRPLLGELESDEDFIEARQYFNGFCYTYDKLPYFEDKTPFVQVYSADFSDGGSSVTVQAIKGDFGIRYMGFGFQFLPAEPSVIREDYYTDYVYIQGNGEESLSRIFAASYEDSIDPTLRGFYYGGFRKNGVYYAVTAENIDEQAFAGILAALYQG